jgi:hypothetical protein
MGFSTRAADSHRHDVPGGCERMILQPFAHALEVLGLVQRTHSLHLCIDLGDVSRVPPINVSTGRPW